MRNDYMRRYWSGYRAAKSDAERYGLDYVRSASLYGLQGCSRAYCDGYDRYADRLTRERRQ